MNAHPFGKPEPRQPDDGWRDQLPKWLMSNMGKPAPRNPAHQANWRQFVEDLTHHNSCASSPTA